MDGILYGMTTLIESDSLDKTIKLCKELKLDFIENIKFIIHIKSPLKYKY